MKFDEMTDQERIIAYSRVLTSNDGENLKQMNLYDVGIFLRDLIVQQQEHNKQKELIDKIKAMLSQNKLTTFEKSFGRTNGKTLKQAKIIIYNEVLDLIKEYEDENVI